MQVSAEIRWFWEYDLPAGLEDWFFESADSCPPGGGGKSHVHQYLRDPSQVELGIKRRGVSPGVEVKGLVFVNYGGLSVGPFVGDIEVWTKWTSGSLELPSSLVVAVEKLRWLRKFDTSQQTPAEIPLGADEQPLGNQSLPAAGCNVELTRIKLPSANVWWTLGFESFGEIWNVQSSLIAVATVLAASPHLKFVRGQSASYPKWLSALQTDNS